MHSMSFVAPSSVFLIAALLFTAPSKAQSTDDDSAGPRGSVPRSSADRYHSHAQSDGTSVGADILTPKQVGKAFVSDLNRCCIVVEFAFYPNKENIPHDLSLDDFALYISGSDIGTKPRSATVVAASLQTIFKDTSFFSPERVFLLQYGDQGSGSSSFSPLKLNPNWYLASFLRS